MLPIDITPINQQWFAPNSNKQQCVMPRLEGRREEMTKEGMKGKEEGRVEGQKDLRKMRFLPLFHYLFNNLGRREREGGLKEGREDGRKK